MPKLTVAMASYNHEKFVGEAIESVLSQKDSDFDFVIVDDGSKDGTVVEILKYQDPRIKFTALEKNQGACVALRKAIEGGTGEYVAILNSDDQFLPGKLKKQIDFLDAHPHVHAVFGYPRFINEKGRVLDRTEHFYLDLFKQPNRSRFEWLNYFFKHQNALCHPTVMLRRSCYESVGYYDPRFAQIPDFDLWVRLLFKYEIHVMPEELINFRILAGEQNMSALRLDTLNRSLWELSHVLENYLKISSVAEYFAIFPEEAPLFKSHDPDLISFYLAQLTLRIDTPNRSVYRVMGLNILFKMLSDPILKVKLERDLNFTYTDFIKISGSHSFVQNVQSPPSFAKRLRKLASPTWVYNKVRSKIKALI